MTERFEFLVAGAGSPGSPRGTSSRATGASAFLEREDQLAFHATGRSAAIYMEVRGLRSRGGVVRTDAEALRVTRAGGVWHEAGTDPVSVYLSLGESF